MSLPDPFQAHQDSVPIPLDSTALLRNASARAGVYLMRDEAGKVIYIGKANNLRKRLRSYFGAGRKHSPKIQALMARARSVELMLSASGAEALVLENNLIKRYQPRYNHLFRDDKSYPHLHLADNQDYPRLRFHRGPRSGDGRYFGPYPDTRAVRSTLRLAQKLFKIRDCKESMFRNRSRPCLQYQINRCSAPCVAFISRADYAADLRRAALFLEGRNEQVIEELTTPMQAAVSRLDYEEAARYRDLIAHLRVVQERHQLSEPGRDVDLAACQLEGGQACVTVFRVRNGVHLGCCAFFPRHLGVGDEEQVLSAFLAQHYLQGGQGGQGGKNPIPREILVSHSLPDRANLARALGASLGQRVRIHRARSASDLRLLQAARENAIYKLQLRRDTRQDWEAHWAELKDLLALPGVPERIECFDISHTGGESTTAACVVFERSGPIHSAYRRYNVPGGSAGDDCAALRWAVSRRYQRRGDAEASAPPECILVDGGLLQVRAVRASLGERGALTRVVGLAKSPDRKPERDCLVLGEPPRKLPPSAGAPPLLLQSIRDEAHRFAIIGHRRRRAGTRRVSVLEEIEGVGRVRRRRLLQHFGGLQGLSRAGIQELLHIPGIHLRLARRIHEVLHPDVQG